MNKYKNIWCDHCSLEKSGKGIGAYFFRQTIEKCTRTISAREWQYCPLCWAIRPKQKLIDLTEFD